MSILTDVIKRSTRALQPLASAVGQGTIYCVTDEGNILERSTGSVWQAYSPAPGQAPVTAPVDSQFSWVNQGTSTVTVNADNSIFMKILGAAGTSYKLRVKTVTAPYTVTAGFRWAGPVTDFHQFGLVLYDGTKFTSYFIACVSTITATLPLFMSQDFANVTTFTSNNLVSATNKTCISSPIWLRIADDNTNKIFSYSPDGYNFMTLFSETRTTFLTATHVGFGGETENASSQDLGFTLVSWSQT